MEILDFLYLSWCMLFTLGNGDLHRMVRLAGQVSLY